MISKISLIASLFIAFLFTFVSATETARGYALILYDPVLNDLSEPSILAPEIKQLLTTLEDDLQYNVKLSTYSDDSVELFMAGEPLYNHVVLLPTSKKSLGAKQELNQHKLMEFIEKEGNILVVGSEAALLPDAFRTFLNELGIYPAPKNFKLIDHFNTVNDKVKLTVANLAKNKVIDSLDVEYEGSAALISNNELLFPIVKSSKTGFSGQSIDSVGEDNTWSFGEQGFLAVGLQALNNARLSWIGSSDLLSEDLVKWTFQEKGVLKLQFVEHIKAESPELPNNTLYRIKDDVIYTIGVSEFVNKSWVPYVVENEDDVFQLSFKMLDPYQRLNLEPLGKASSVEDSDDLDTFVYYVNFTIPDHHGMFTFELDYKRSGFSYLIDNRIVAVRHLANDEYKRSWEITNSWLYVASAALVTVSWFIFVISFSTIRHVDSKKKNI